jgi:hypothetical protein
MCIRDSFITVADISRLASTPVLKGFFEQSLFKGEDSTVRTIGSLLTAEDAVSMLALGVNFGAESEPPLLYVILQGDFGRLSFLKSIKRELKKQNMTLSSALVEDMAIYWQEDSADPFAFALPDSQHLIVSTKSSLVKLLEQAELKKEFPFSTVDSPLFGILKPSERIIKVLPPQVASLKLATFSTDDQGQVHIVAELLDVEQARNLEAFLLGMKALYLLQMDKQKVSQEILETVNIGSVDNFVLVDAPLEELLGLIVSEQ